MSKEIIKWALPIGSALITLGILYGTLSSVQERHEAQIGWLDVNGKDMEIRVTRMETNFNYIKEKLDRIDVKIDRVAK